MNETSTNSFKIINRDMIKYIAAVPMIIGHFVSYLQMSNILHYSFMYTIMASMALFAPPIFFFSITDGYVYTRSHKNYALRLLVFAAVTQIPFTLVTCGTLLTIETIRTLNVFFTLLAGLFAIIVWESKYKLGVRVLGIILIDGLTVLLSCEWMIFGVLMIVGMHIFRDKQKARLIWFIACVVLNQFITWGMSPVTFISPGFITGTLVMLSAYFARTIFYNGQKGSHPAFSKWFFYIIYPLHFVMIYITVLIIK